MYLILHSNLIGEEERTRERQTKAVTVDTLTKWLLKRNDNLVAAEDDDSLGNLPRRTQRNRNQRDRPTRAGQTGCTLTKKKKNKAQRRSRRFLSL